MVCNRLPEITSCENWADFKEYDDLIYSFFKRDFIDSQPTYKNSKVVIRKNPLVNNKEQTFFHITSKEYKEAEERLPDPRRCERIEWIRKFIENDFCIETCNICDGIKTWEVPYKNTKRIYFLLEEERFVVIIEKRDNYYLLITAYYLDYDHSLKKLLKKYSLYKAESVSQT